MRLTSDANDFVNAKKKPCMGETSARRVHHHFRLPFIHHHYHPLSLSYSSSPSSISPSSSLSCSLPLSFLSSSWNLQRICVKIFTSLKEFFLLYFRSGFSLRSFSFVKFQWWRWELQLTIKGMHSHIILWKTNESYSSLQHLLTPV